MSCQQIHDQDDQTSYIIELKNHFGQDERRINHALKVLNFATQIMNEEKITGITRRVVMITALLHDVGIKAAEQKYQSSAGQYQEIEGPPIARTIMSRLGEVPELIERVAYIIGGHHTAAKNNGIDFQIIWEADLIVNIEEEGLNSNPEQVRKIIAKNFSTPAGRRIVQEFFLN